eukprot:scaffold2243_cov73-Cyclotella_meneghiniana.AAC.15
MRVDTAICISTIIVLVFIIHSNNDVLCITELRPRSTVKAVGGSLVAGAPCNSVGVGGVVLEQIGNLVDITI